MTKQGNESTKSLNNQKNKKQIFKCVLMVLLSNIAGGLCLNLMVSHLMLNIPISVHMNRLLWAASLLVAIGLLVAGIKRKLQCSVKIGCTLGLLPFSVVFSYIFMCEYLYIRWLFLALFLWMFISDYYMLIEVLKRAEEGSSRIGISEYVPKFFVKLGIRLAGGINALTLWGAFLPLLILAYWNGNVHYEDVYSTNSQLYNLSETVSLYDYFKEDLKNFKEEVYYALPIEEKANCLQTIVNIECEYLGLSEHVQVVLQDIERDSLCGYCKDNTIIIDKDIAESSLESGIFITLHEVYHVYQKVVCDAVNFDSIDNNAKKLKFYQDVYQWDYEFRNYINAEESYKEYTSQQVEKSANAYAYEWLVSYLKYIEGL